MNTPAPLSYVSSAEAPSPAVLLKLAHEDARVMVDTMRADMLAWEDRRSKHRNGNRLLVLAVAFAINVTWPTLMLRVLHHPAGGFWTPAISSGADILVTLWALKRRF